MRLRVEEFKARSRARPRGGKTTTRAATAILMAERATQVRSRPPSRVRIGDAEEPSPVLRWMSPGRKAGIEAALPKANHSVLILLPLWRRPFVARKRNGLGKLGFRGLPPVEPRRRSWYFGRARTSIGSKRQECREGLTAVQCRNSFLI